MDIDITFNMQTDAGGRDPDSHSPTLKRYHKLLWSKPLPNGQVLELRDDYNGPYSASYLYHHSDLGEFFLSSDAITHSYRNQQKFKWITEQIPEHVDELYDAGSTIGAFTLFPKKQIGGKNNINQARGMNSLINDRFDLTLECIRRYYKAEDSPLYDTLLRYHTFFDLFDSFEGYIQFFLLSDLIDKNGRIKFYLPFDDFKSKPDFIDINDYLIYKEKILDFIVSRNKRIKNDVENRKKLLIID